MPTAASGSGPSRLIATESSETVSLQAEQQEWLAAKRTFREAACRLLSKTMLEVRPFAALFCSVFG